VFGGLPENCLAIRARNTDGIASDLSWNYCIKPLTCKAKASICIICLFNIVVIHDSNFKSFAEVHAKASEMLVSFARCLMDI
jgi:hypothetical protein